MKFANKRQIQLQFTLLQQLRIHHGTRSEEEGGASSFTSCGWARGQAPKDAGKYMLVNVDADVGEMREEIVMEKSLGSRRDDCALAPSHLLSNLNPHCLLRIYIRPLLIDANTKKPSAEALKLHKELTVFLIYQQDHDFTETAESTTAAGLRFVEQLKLARDKKYVVLAWMHS